MSSSERQAYLSFVGDSVLEPLSNKASGNTGKAEDFSRCPDVLPEG